MIDFLIIGGGIAGISAAARLAPLGATTVIEAEDVLGYHATGRSAAMFLVNYGNEVIRALNRASAAHHATADGGVLAPRGLMNVAKAPDRQRWEAEAKDTGMEEITLAEARDWVPILHSDIAFAAANHDASELDTDLLLQNFARTARKHGAEIITGAQAKTITRLDGHWQVETAKGNFTAVTLINAAGAWVDEVAGLAGVKPLGFTPLRRSMARLPAPGGHDVSNWPLLEGPHHDWYAKPDAGKLLVSPADEELVEPHDAWADDMVLAEGLARYEANVTEPVTRVETSWAGLRTFSPDRALVIGRDTAQPEFVWCAGQGGYGFQTAPAASQLLADLVAGRPPELAPEVVAALSPSRFSST